MQNAPKYYETRQNMSSGSNGVVRCICCEKFKNEFMTQTCALIAQVQPILHRVSCSIKILPNALKCYATHQNTGPLGWIWGVHCEKFQGDFMARTCALIAPVQPILHQVLCSNESLPNAPKHYETHQNIILGCNGADWVHSL